jgi:hypothetical protein
MRAASLPRFLLGLPRWLLVAAALVAILVWVLLAFAAGVIGESPVTPADGPLVGPFRWSRPDSVA